MVDPDESTEYEVVVVDNCDYSEFASTKVDVQTVKTTIVRESLGDDTYAFDVLTDPVEPFEGAYFYVWEFGDDNVAYERAPTHTYDGLVPIRSQSVRHHQHWLFRRRAHGHLRRCALLHPHRVHA